ncbi:hypothetical protein IWX64_002086 [Arthrobacter sp. CAN_A212]
MPLQKEAAGEVKDQGRDGEIGVDPSGFQGRVLVLSGPGG